VLEEALNRAAPALTSREVAVEQQVPPGLGLRAHPGPLSEGLAALLTAASAAATRASVIELRGRSTEDGIEIELELESAQEAADPGLLGAELHRAHQIVESLGGQLTASTGRLCLFLSNWHDEEYSAGT
jgi:hypothetical protein